MVFRSKRPDGHVLQRLQERDDRAWSDFTHEWGSRLYNHMRRKGIPAEHIEDLVGDVILGVCRGIDSFDGERATLKTWVYTIANNKISDFWRKYNRYQSVELTETTRTETLVVRDEPAKRIAFYEALEQMKSASREILLLKYKDGLGVGEIAEQLDLTYKAAESRLTRARREFESLLREQEPA